MPPGRMVDAVSGGMCLQTRMGPACREVALEGRAAL